MIAFFFYTNKPFYFLSTFPADSLIENKKTQTKIYFLPEPSFKNCAIICQILYTLNLRTDYAVLAAQSFCPAKLLQNYSSSGISQL